MNTEIKHRPILFSGEMVRAILEGRKTQTRRVVKSRHESGLFQVCFNKATGNVTGIESLDWDERNIEKDVICPYGKPGDVLWVRESFAELKNGHNEKWIEYKADGMPNHSDFGDWKWKPSIHMPKAACRLFLKIKSVRVERLQDISEADAVAEGVDNWTWKDMAAPQNWLHYSEENAPPLTSAVDSFITLWEKINGLGSFLENPWVWVVEFEKCDKPENF